MGAAGIDDRPAATGFHAGAKTVVAFSFKLTGLKGSLAHDFFIPVGRRRRWNSLYLAEKRQVVARHILSW